ncbi:hypothetical protein [Pseudonocardia yunnanensis]|uniref:Uncharacterized protein n=1 Tax=Pseudonocardia yunnanensis TaxID=58107 RepID=A0ABW4F163_9PSEU
MSSASADTITVVDRLLAAGWSLERRRSTCGLAGWRSTGSW